MEDLLQIGAAYIRVSDERQDKYSPDSQLKKIREYADWGRLIKKYSLFNETFSELLTILTIAVIFIIFELQRYYKEKKSRNLISWSVIGDYCPTFGRNSYVSELSYTIINAPYKYGIK